jgi:hypothetical protein
VETVGIEPNKDFLVLRIDHLATFPKLTAYVPGNIKVYQIYLLIFNIPQGFYIAYPQTLLAMHLKSTRALDQVLKTL